MAVEIPVLLLKTRTVPEDGYEDYFSVPVMVEKGVMKFKPVFVPVLEHTPNAENLERLEALLRSGELKRRYGGMIFTSQRAVEGWRGVVERVEMRSENESESESGMAEDLSNNEESITTASQQYYTRGTLSNPTTTAEADTLDYASPHFPLQDSDLPFPLYVVGPATERSLASLLLLHPPHETSSSSARSKRNDSSHRGSSPAFMSLNPQILGAHTGSGAALAPFILKHYNTLQSHRMFTFWEAPRLPFIPLVGPGPSPSKTAEGTGTVRRGGMVRLERGDGRLEKKPLLFLVGETRRDVIPKTLMDVEGLGEEERVVVEEVEVYRTEEQGAFAEEFERCLKGLMRREEGQQRGVVVVVVVVFSPQGCESMLSAIGYLDARGQLSEKAKRRWGRDSPRVRESDSSSRAEQQEDDSADAGGATTDETKFVVATIGPTTRDYLIDRFGFEPDVCAKRPSPEGVCEEIKAFLLDKGLF